MKDVSAVEKANARKAVAAHVKIALGTDAAVYPHDLNAHELEVYVAQFGMAPLATIQTGTVNAADLMGWTDKTGSLETGKWADIIAVKGDSSGREVTAARCLRHEIRKGVQERAAIRDRSATGAPRPHVACSAVCILRRDPKVNAAVHEPLMREVNKQRSAL